MEKIFCVYLCSSVSQPSLSICVHLYPEQRNMKVTRIKIDNFKSLVDFELNMAKFACLVGLNGSGKSTVLHCFDFLAQQCKGDIQA